MTYLEADPKDIGPNDIKKTCGATFYFSVKFLSRNAIKNASMVFAFYRHSKNLAALPETKRSKEELAKLEEELDAPSNTFMVRLKETMEQLNIKRLCAKEIIDAARFDCSKKSIKNHSQLMIYCYKNSGALALMMAPTLGVGEASARAFALDLGVAANLTNVCRSVLAEANAGRSLLPVSELAHLKLDLKELARRGETPIELKKLVERYLQLADTYYESALSGISHLPFPARLGILIAIKLHQNVGEKIRHCDYNVLNEAIHLNPLDKLLMVPKALMETFRPRFWFSGKHRALLHAHFLGMPGVEAREAVSRVHIE